MIISKIGGDIVDGLILRLYKKCDPKNRISIPRIVIDKNPDQDFNVDFTEGFIFIYKSKDGKIKSNVNKRIVIPAKIKEKVDTNEFYMEVYEKYIRLVPITKRGV